MRHGRRLTPLGKQLRTVIHGLTAAARPEPPFQWVASTIGQLKLFHDNCYDVADGDSAKTRQASRSRKVVVDGHIPGVPEHFVDDGARVASGRSRKGSDLLTPKSSGVLEKEDKQRQALGNDRSVEGYLKSLVQESSHLGEQRETRIRHTRLTNKAHVRRLHRTVETAKSKDAPPVRSMRALKTLDDRLTYKRMPSQALDAALSSLELKQSLPYSPRPPRPYSGYVDKSKQDWYKRWKAKQKAVDSKNVKITNASMIRKVSRGRARSPLPTITATVIRQGSTESGISGHDLSHLDQKALRSRGYCDDDVLIWASALKEPDAALALRKLVEKHQRLGAQTLPLFVFHHILRRPLLNGAALRAALDYFRILINNLAAADTECLEATQFAQPLRQISTRLVDHALNSWPQALPAVLDMVLECISAIEKKSRPVTEAQLCGTTYFLNSLMGQISLASTHSRFKLNDYQQEALVKILRYLSEHRPAMHVSREGYRAVIRVQLAQRKTPQEQEWAELKALSWPPWKHDRTGMDEAIGPEHGISRAGETLNQMRRAGYAWKEWERIANVHAGWDTDWTPTIQTRSILGRDHHQYSTGERIWAARINATRTLQEAWACFLAWEDAKMTPAQSVYLAIFEKIFAEKRRQLGVGTATESEDIESAAWPLYPGDTPTVEPLPPSTHLYTYTRTSPPTIDGLYEQLREQGVQFYGETLAFLVTSADDVATGFKYIQHAAQHSPGLQSLRSKAGFAGLNDACETVLIATIKLLSRFAHVKVHKTLDEPESISPHKSSSDAISLFSDWQLARNTCIAQAMALLRARPLTNKHAWHSVSRNITRPEFFAALVHVIERPTGAKPFDRSAIRNSIWNETSTQHDVGAMIAYRLTRETLALAQQHHVQLDSLLFQDLCRATEKMALSSWSLVQNLGDQPSALRDHSWPGVQAECHRFLATTTSLAEELHASFLTLTCPAKTPENDIQTTAEESTTSLSPSSLLPRLVTVPNPAALHAYIRALGALGAHDHLLHLTRWMATYRAELQERQNLDRSGARMMRRAIIAIRVFLERSFLPALKLSSSSIPSSSAAKSRGEGLLRKMREPAPELVLTAVQGIMDDEDNSRAWAGGWPTREEVWGYCAKMHAAALPRNK